MDTGVHYFFDRYGKLRTVSACSFNDYDRLLHLYHIFWKLIFEIDSWESFDFRELIEKQPKVLEVSKAILKLSGIKFKWIDSNLLAFLVYSYTDNEENPHKGFIYELNFKPNVQEKIEGLEQTTTTWEDYYFSVLAQLTLIEGSFEKALKVIENESKPIIEGTLQKRAELLKKQQQDPEDKLGKIADGKKKYAEMIKRRKEKAEQEKILKQNGNSV